MIATRSRPVVIQVSLSEDEYDEVQGAADAEGLSPSACLSRVAVGSARDHPRRSEWATGWM